MKPLTVGSLFAGIGGFDLGFERAGFEIKWQVEIDPFCRRVLEKHWPHVRRYEDVREVYGYGTYGYEGAHERRFCALDRVDVIVGGFPCQPVSLAGARRAQSDERWLWPDFARLVGELRPGYVVVENVPGLLTAGFGIVIGDLAALGYDAEWECLPARAFGAPHIRERVWIVAYPGSERQQEWRESDSESARGREVQLRRDPCGCGTNVADANRARPQERFVFRGVPGQARCDDYRQDAAVGGWWSVEPNVGRVADGVSARVDRLRGLGNAIVPQIAEWIARRILEAEGLA
jgi:DNA (cytosine-5)-methyltransferase 1